MRVLTTDRLILRPFRMDDLDAFHEYSKNPEIGPNAGWKPHESKAESKFILKGYIEDDDAWAITAKDGNDQVIGSVGLHRDRIWGVSGIRMLGYVLAEACWGNGYATEASHRVIRFAFEELKLSILTIYHFAFNVRSRRVVEKCGFVYDGTLRNATFLPDGAITDDICYSLTNMEYFAKNRQ